MATGSSASNRFANFPLALLACLVCLGSASASPQSDPLESFNSALEKVVKQVAPAVVEIDVTEQPGSDPDDDANSDAGNHDVADAKLRPRFAVGSGVIVDRSGYIITNAHVVRNARSLHVLLDKSVRSKYSSESGSGTKSTLPARVVGEFTEADLAVIKVDASDLPTVSFDAQDTLHQGQMVIAFGSPEGLQNSVTIGVVSSAARQVTPDGHLLYIQTDAAINPGNSGGPLVNIRGALVGINSFFFTEGGGSEGLGFAVPGRLVQFVYQSILQNGQVTWGNTGVRVQGITSALAEGLNLPRDSGVLVSDVDPGTPAESAGIEAGDVILALDRKPVESVPDYYEMLYHTSPGKKVNLAVLRANRFLNLEVPAIAIQEGRENKALSPPIVKLVSRLGVVCSELGSQPGVDKEQFRSRAGVLVDASASSNEPHADLAPSDIIRSVNLRPVSSVGELQSALDTIKPGAPIVLQIERKAKFIFLAVDLN